MHRAEYLDEPGTPDEKWRSLGEYTSAASYAIAVERARSFAHVTGHQTRVVLEEVIDTFDPPGR